MTVNELKNALTQAVTILTDNKQAITSQVLAEMYIQAPKITQLATELANLLGTDPATIQQWVTVFGKFLDAENSLINTGAGDQYIQICSALLNRPFILFALAEVL